MSREFKVGDKVTRVDGALKGDIFTVLEVMSEDRYHIQHGNGGGTATYDGNEIELVEEGEEKPETKFKIGDKVLIRDTEGFEELHDKICTITENDGEDDIPWKVSYGEEHHQHEWFNAEDMELVASEIKGPEPVYEFKVGDKVLKNGNIDTIDKHDTSYNTRYPWHLKSNYWARTDELELVVEEFKGVELQSECSSSNTEIKMRVRWDIGDGATDRIKQVLEYFEEGEVNNVDKTINMSLVKKMKDLFATEPVKSLTRHGFLCEEGTITHTGMEVYLTHLIKSDEGFQKDVIEKLNKAEDKKKK